MTSLSTPIGLEALRTAVSSAPTAPGIYKMLDAEARILYVGKAKNLRNRLASYTNTGGLTNRILRMVAQIARVEIVTTKNEAEALLVEASLIKKHQPRYNVLLKDDKSFPYLRIDTTHPFPRIEKHRGAQNKPGEYFGPFANVLALNAAMALLQKIFLLRPCADTVFKNRTRPCLQYQIKRCTAPCVGYVSAAEYAGQLARARDFLKGRGREVQDALGAEMNEASASLDYEKAALIRDRIRALTQVQQEQGLRIPGLTDADIIALARRGDKSAVQVFFYRNGSPFGNQAFYPRHSPEESDAEILMGFLGQFYQAHLPPREIVVGIVPPPAGGRLGGGHRGQTVSGIATTEQVPPPPHPSPEGGGSITLPPLARVQSPESSETETGLSTLDSDHFTVLAEALSLRAEYKVEIHTPQRGDKLRLLEQAQKNAEAALTRLEMERASIETQLLALKEIFKLPKTPQRIEVYDNSHISGTHAVGAFIVATPEGFDKKSYRIFNIKGSKSPLPQRGRGWGEGDYPQSNAGEISPSPSLSPFEGEEYFTPGDDYAMMREVFRRRFKGVARGTWRVASEDDAEIISQAETIGHISRVTHHVPRATPFPDLILIDGGQGQLTAVEQVLSELGLTSPPRAESQRSGGSFDGREAEHAPMLETGGTRYAPTLIAIAKGEGRNAGREWFFQPGRAPFQLPVNEPVLHYLQRLRDEAHRYVIGRHRGKRSKSLTVSVLEDIPGIGPGRKRALLKHFGSRADVETATIQELQKVEGISRATAQAIYDYFHG